MDMKYVTYFLAIAKYRNLSKAADHLFVSQSTLSQFLAREEETLGVQLLSRNRNELTLTPAGQLYEETCRNMLNLQETLYKRLADITESKTGHIAIGITPQWGGDMFAEIFPIFKHKYPNFLVNLLESTTKPLLEQVTKGSLDIAIIATPEHLPLRLPNTLLAREALILAVPVTLCEPTEFKARPDILLPSIDIRKLKSENFIISCSGTAIRDITNKVFDDHSFHPNIICEINNHASSLKMVESGLGVAIIPLSYKKNTPNIRYFTIGTGVFWNICSVVRRNFIAMEPDLYLIELIKRYFSCFL
ncbi:MAG: LysR family transcriptional regulator [Lachnospiraceae bacterium]